MYFPPCLEHLLLKLNTYKPCPDDLFLRLSMKKKATILKAVYKEEDLFELFRSYFTRTEHFGYDPDETVNRCKRPF